MTQVAFYKAGRDDLLQETAANKRAANNTAIKTFSRLIYKAAISDHTKDQFTKSAGGGRISLVFGQKQEDLVA